MLEHRIAQLEERLLSARVITKKEISKDVVSVGSHVRLRDIAGEQDVRVPHRRLRRGEPVREQALERVAGRQGDHGQEEGRDRRGRRTARLAEVQDPRDQGRVARSGVSSTSVSDTLHARAGWRSCGSNERGWREASDMLARAFQDDPAWVWLIPDPQRACAACCPGSSASASTSPPRTCGRRPAPVLGARAVDCRPGRAGPMHVGADAARARRDAARASAPRPGRSSPTGGRSRRCAPRRCPGRTGTSPGSASTRRRSGRASARRSCSPGSPPPPQRECPACC